MITIHEKITKAQLTPTPPILTKQQLLSCFFYLTQGAAFPLLLSLLPIPVIPATPVIPRLTRDLRSTKGGF